MIAYDMIMLENYYDINIAQLTQASRKFYLHKIILALKNMHDTYFVFP